MQSLEYQVRIAFDDGTEECNCFATLNEARTVYHDRLSSEKSGGEIELLQVYAQHRIEEHYEPVICGDCKLEVEEIVRKNSKGVTQCSACYLAEEGPQE